MNLYQQSGSSYLIGWKLEMGVASLFSMTRVKVCEPRYYLSHAMRNRWSMHILRMLEGKFRLTRSILYIEFYHNCHVTMCSVYVISIKVLGSKEYIKEKDFFLFFFIETPRMTVWNFSLKSLPLDWFKRIFQVTRMGQWSQRKQSIINCTMIKINCLEVKFVPCRFVLFSEAAKRAVKRTANRKKYIPRQE